MPETTFAIEDLELRRRILARLTGAHFEVVEAIVESYELHAPTQWVAELERARIAITAALAWLT